MNAPTDFTVAGSGEFPLDMLRYDECWPVDGNAVAAMTGEGRRGVQLRTNRRMPTRDRWDSFSWKVTAVDGRPVFPKPTKAQIDAEDAAVNEAERRAS